MECDPRGPSPKPDVCQRVGVRAYPTWFVNGQRHEGVLDLDRLAALSGYAGPPTR